MFPVVYCRDISGSFFFFFFFFYRKHRGENVFPGIQEKVKTSSESSLGLEKIVRVRAHVCVRYQTRRDVSVTRFSAV